MYFSLQKKDDVKEKTLTKGRFPRNYMTNAGVWVQDRQWKKLANKKEWEKDARLEAADQNMLERRKKQKLLQNTALEAQYKI